MYKIYMHTLNGKSYIGQTCKNLATRFGKDFQGYQECPYFYHAIEKYGAENVKTEILYSNLSLEEANRLESLCIFRYNTIAPYGYNLHTGGLNHTVSEITRQKLSRAHKGKTVSPETRRRMSEASQKRNTPEYRHKLTLAQLGEKNHNFGKATPDSVKRKLSIAFSGENNPAYRDDIDRDDICKRYLAGEPARRIAKSVGVGSTTVYRILQKSGILRSRSEAQKGKKASAETRKKMSNARKGNRNSFYGKKHSAEARRKISESRRSRQRKLSEGQLTLF